MPPMPNPTHPLLERLDAILASRAPHPAGSAGPAAGWASLKDGSGPIHHADSLNPGTLEPASHQHDTRMHAARMHAARTQAKEQPWT